MRRRTSYLALGAAVVALAIGLTLLLVLRERKPSLSPEQAAAVEHGAELYGRMCSVCHGDNGEGYKADNAPMLRHPEFLASVSDDFLRTAILDGRSGTVMSAWGKERGGPLSPADASAVVAFLRTWESKPRAKLESRRSRGSARRAEPVFARECANCHGPRGVGGPNVNIGNPELLKTASDGFLRHAISAGREGTPMPAFAGKLQEREIDDLLALLRTWERPSPPPPKPVTRQAPLPLGPVPLNPKGAEPAGFVHHPKGTSVDVVAAAMQKGARLALLDARAPSDYMREHIAGAVSVPFYDSAPYYDKLPKDAWLVAYCSCPHAESKKLAADLIAAGFKKVTILEEGLGVWRSKKYPIQSGDQP